jgi:enoyl-CoA hydratase
MSFQNILFTTDAEGVAILTVNRPQKLNALNGDVMAEIDAAVAQCETDAHIRALIITGAGDRAFVAGADIRELQGLSAIQAQASALRGQAILRRLERLTKPTVAAINGYALGGGLELAMCCAIRVCCPEARLGQPEVKLGILCGYGGTQRLPRLVGRGRALELLLSAEAVDAAEAHRMGLVNFIAPAAELIESCKAWLRKALANAPLALALTMEAVDVGLSSGLEEGLRYEAAAFGLAAATEDRAEGMTAFLEKRSPAFAGK